MTLEPDLFLWCSIDRCQSNSVYCTPPSKAENKEQGQLQRPHRAAGWFSVARGHFSRQDIRKVSKPDLLFTVSPCCLNKNCYDTLSSTKPTCYLFCKQKLHILHPDGFKGYKVIQLSRIVYVKKKKKKGLYLQIFPVQLLRVRKSCLNS